MNSEQYSRFLFIGFEDLKKIKFDKLEQVCDKVFVFVNKDEKAIPFSLVHQLQKLGENVQWVAVTDETPESTCQFLSFHLGLTHEQVDEDIEFAIISEDSSFDSLISYLNEQGRNTMRVTRNKEKQDHTSDLTNISWSTKGENVAEEEEIINKESTILHKSTPSEEQSISEFQPSSASPSNQQLSERVARETVKRLVMSGNRPAAIDSLKSYILLQYNNAEVNRHIDLIIRKLEKSNEILLKDKEVHYNF